MDVCVCRKTNVENGTQTEKSSKIMSTSVRIHRFLVAVVILMNVVIVNSSETRLLRSKRSVPLINGLSTVPAAYATHQALANMGTPSHITQHPLVRNAIQNSILNHGNAVSGLAGHPVYGGPTITPPVQQRVISAAINGNAPLTTLGNVPLITSIHHPLNENILSSSSSPISSSSSSLPTILTSRSSDTTSPKTTTTTIITTTTT